jgi:hypothetical protein
VSRQPCSTRRTLWPLNLEPTAAQGLPACPELAASRRGEPLPLVTDIDIGVVALEACQALAAAGFTFTWH